MGKKDARVDAYIAASADFAKPVLIHLRRLIHSACPQVEETIKWRFPFFAYKGILCNLAAFKNHCAFGFWHPGMASVLKAKPGGSPMQHFRNITSLADLPNDAVLTRYIREAAKLNETGVKPVRKKSPAKPLPVPAYLSKFLAANQKALLNFKALRPSHKNEYVQWIIEAKHDQTRQRRLVTMAQWLSQGKSRNWKYEL